MLATKSAARTVRPAAASRRTAVRVQAVDPSLVIGGSTAAMLAVGRFAFMPFQRRKVAAAVQESGPKTTGTTYFDSLQQDASFITTTQDPAGFTLIDVFAWGALGHALGFAILAADSAGGLIPGVGP